MPGFLSPFAALCFVGFFARLSYEKHFGTAMGTFGTIFDIGHASGHILAGFLVVRYDYLYSFGAMAVTLLLVAPVFILMVKEK